MKLFNKTLILAATIMLTGCLALQDKVDLRNMEEAQYKELKHKISSITEIVASRISMEWPESKKAKAMDALSDTTKLLTENQLGELEATDLVRTLTDRFGAKLGLNDQARRDIKDAALIISTLVGPIKLDANGMLHERETGVLLSLLQGLERGLE